MTQNHSMKSNVNESGINADQQRGHDSYQRYCIVIAGELDPSWSEWLGNLQCVAGQDKEGRSITTLCGEISDQAALRSILNKIWDLHLTLLSVNQVHVSSNEKLRR
jgi:hypothetical protein